MKFSEKWLRQWVNPPVDSKALAEKLTMAGLEIESLTAIGLGESNIRVGLVINAEKHPDADRLRVCTVSVNPNEPNLTIVCGGANVRTGLKVPVALVGAKLPGLEIKKAKIRGVESFGMICSTTELQLTETSEGIMELPEDAPIGMEIAEYLQLPDTIFDVNLTTNRSDCLSIQGMARETSALFNLNYSALQIQNIAATINDVIPVQVTAAIACPRYLGRIIKGISTTAKTPLWMQEKLQRSGIRSIHPVVDINNYVMLELGQPLHAFDLNSIKGGIQVRMSTPDEKIILLDDQELSLDSSLVISDSEKLLALAGIMGGKSSSVTEATTDIFIESAFFHPDALSPTLRKSPIPSDSAHRFERGVDPELCMQAMARVTELLQAIVGGEIGPIIECVDRNELPKPITIALRRERIARILGITLPDTTVEQILTGLGMQLTPQENGWQVAIPSYRFDLQIEVDLIEELARVYGFNQIPSQLPVKKLHMLPISETLKTANELRNFWMNQGFHEAINYSFVDPKIENLFNPDAKALRLANPISEELSVMRTSLWPGLIQAALFNLNRQQNLVRLFEIGVCFNSVNDQLEQKNRIAGIVFGPVAAEQWSMQSRNYDFYDLKGVIENLFSTLSKTEFSYNQTAHPALHPGRSAAILRKQQLIGFCGELHPKLQQEFGIQSRVYLFELQLDGLTEAELPVYKAPSKFPSIRRDLAFTVAEAISFQQLHDCIQTSGGDTLQSVQLFDVYRGTGIKPGEKSMALSLTFQSSSRTLIDSEIDGAMNNIVGLLKQQYSAALRT